MLSLQNNQLEKWKQLILTVVLKRSHLNGNQIASCKAASHFHAIMQINTRDESQILLLNPFSGTVFSTHKSKQFKILQGYSQ